MFFNAQLLARPIVEESFFAISLLLWGWPAFSQHHASRASACGTWFSRGQFGPCDYCTNRDRLPAVEGAHLTPRVAALMRGKTGGGLQSKQH